MVPFFPEVDYVGFDLSPDYIRRARAKYADKLTGAEWPTSYPELCLPLPTAASDYNCVHRWL
jgi:hypothetical protein